MFSIKIKVTAFFLSFIVLLLGNGILLSGIISDKTSENSKQIIRDKTSIQTTVFAQEASEDETVSDSSEPDEPLTEDIPLNSSMPNIYENTSEEFIPSDSLAVDEEGPYEAGFYSIGADMPPGIYKLTADEGQAGFYRISDSIKEEYYSITDNDVFNTFTYILVKEGEYLNLVDASALSLDQAKGSSALQLSYSNGKYLAGKDVPAGTYKVVPDGKSGYVEIASSPVRSVSDIIFSRIIHESIQISLLEDQYIKLSSARIEPVK